jgi:hypothetical protein
MKTKLIVFWLAISSFPSLGQNEETNSGTFYQFDLLIPLIRTERVSVNEASSQDSKVIFNGIAAKFGYGIQHQKWIGLSVNSGLDWALSEKLLAIPLYGNLRLSYGFQSESRITLQAGYGIGYGIINNYNFANYGKLSLGLETDNDFILFAEISGYNFKNNIPYVGIIGLGIAVRTF